MAVECEHGQLARSCQLCELEDKNEQLRAELTERDEAHRRIMAEPCGDERHCTCVPVLRGEIERLRGVLQQISDWCWTGDGAHALPYEPPWAKAMQAALDAAGGCDD